MAIGQSFGQSFGGIQTIQPIKEEEKMQSELFPGFSTKQIKQLEADTKDVPANEKVKAQTEIYRQVLPIVQARESSNKRTATKNSLYNAGLQEKDPQKAKLTMAQVKIEDLADIIKEKNNVNPQASTDDVMNLYKQELAQNQIDPKLVEDYINGTSEELLYATELKERPVEIEEEKTLGDNIKDVGEGIVGFAGSIPKVIAETGILDVPMEKLSKSKIGEFIRDTAGLIFSDEQLEQFQAENKGKTFSEFAEGEQVGGDPDSKLAKGVETGLDIAEGLSGIAGIAAGIGKRATKKGSKKAIKKVTEIIADPEKTKNVQKALKEKRLTETTSGKIKRWLVGEKGATITPSKQIEDAAEIIQTNIKKPANTPTGLYSQITDYVSNKAKTLSSNLKKIDISKTWDKTEIKLSLKELAENTDEFTKSEIKKIKEFSTKINKATNLDELWTVRKEFDNMFSNAVKNASDISAPATRRANKLWKSTRNILNDKIDEISETISDISTKTEFKDMSAMFKASQNIIDKVGTSTLKPTEGLISKKNIVKAGAGAVGLKILGSTIGD